MAQAPVASVGLKTAFPQTICPGSGLFGNNASNENVILNSALTSPGNAVMKQAVANVKGSIKL